MIGEKNSMTIYETFQSTRRHNPFTFYQDDETHIPDMGDSLLALDNRLSGIDMDRDARLKLAGDWQMEML